MHDRDLTPQERKAFEELPRERRPGDLLEERVVRSLRSRGVLRAAGRRQIPVTPAFMAAAAAAVLAVIVGSFALGQWAGSRQTTQAMLAMHERDSLQLATAVQQAGTAYVTALAALASQRFGQDPRTMEQGKEVALTALHAAANQVVSLVPDDPVARNILLAMEQSRQQQDKAIETDKENQHEVVWF